MLRYTDYVRILVRPNFPVTCDGDSLADCEDAIILDGFKRDTRRVPRVGAAFLERLQERHDVCLVGRAESFKQVC